jgi:aconitate hydratase
MARFSSSATSGWTRFEEYELFGLHARIHWQNLINFGVLPLSFSDANDYDRIHASDTVRIANVEAALRAGNQIVATIDGSDTSMTLQHNLSQRQIEILMAGGAINWQCHRSQGA